MEEDDSNSDSESEYSIFDSSGSESDNEELHRKMKDRIVNFRNSQQPPKQVQPIKEEKKEALNQSNDFLNNILLGVGAGIIVLMSLS